MRIRAFLFSAAIVLAAPRAWADDDQPSAADVESARASFQEGLELRDKNNDLPRAIEKLKAAYALVQTPRIAYELGKTYRMAKNYLSARETFLEVDRLPVRARESDEAKKARADAHTQAVELESKIPTLTLNVVGEGGVIQDTSITIDDQPVSHETYSVPRKLNPGRHVIALQIPGRPIAKRNIDLREGEQKQIEIKLPKPNAAPSGDPADDGFKTTDVEKTTTRGDPVHVTLLWSTVGLITVGAVAGLWALGTAADASKSCSSSTMVCGQSALNGKNQATTLAWVANISFGAAIVTGLAYFLIPGVEITRGTTVGVSPMPGGGFLSMQGKF
jgi:hypothetical protein